MSEIVEANHGKSELMWRHRVHKASAIELFLIPPSSLLAPVSVLETPTQLFFLYSSLYRMSVQNLNSFGKYLYRSLPWDELRRCVDPFADEGDPLGSNKDVGSQQNYIHIRIQQRNGRKTLTTLQGLPKGLFNLVLLLMSSSWPDFPVRRVWFQEALEGFQEGITRFSCPFASQSDYRIIQEFACNGTLVDDEEMGQVIQLQGDQRVKISTFLTEEGIPKNTIKLHGFWARIVYGCHSCFWIIAWCWFIILEFVLWSCLCPLTLCSFVYVPTFSFMFRIKEGLFLILWSCRTRSSGNRWG